MLMLIPRKMGQNDHGNLLLNGNPRLHHEGDLLWVEEVDLLDDHQSLLVGDLILRFVVVVKHLLGADLPLLLEVVLHCLLHGVFDLQQGPLRVGCVAVQSEGVLHLQGAVHLPDDLVALQEGLHSIVDVALLQFVGGAVLQFAGLFVLVQGQSHHQEAEDLQHGVGGHHPIPDHPVPERQDEGFQGVAVLGGH